MQIISQSVILAVICQHPAIGPLRDPSALRRQQRKLLSILRIHLVHIVSKVDFLRSQKTPVWSSGTINLTRRVLNSEFC